MNYTACELIRPLEKEQRGEGDDSYTVYAFTARAIGSAKSMRRLVKSKGGQQNGWIVVVTSTPIGGKTFASGQCLPRWIDRG